MPEKVFPFSLDGWTASRELPFPALSDEMLDRCRKYGTNEQFLEGAVLYPRGARRVDFFIVLNGSVIIAGPDEHGVDTVVTILRRGEFTGGLDMLADRETIVSARTGTPADLICISHGRFLECVTTESDIADIVMRTLLLRRLNLMHRSQGGVALLGSSRRADTLRIESFLSRNSYPYRLLDVEVNPEGTAMMDTFHINVEELPVVLSKGTVLRNPSNARLADVLGLAEDLSADVTYDLAIAGAGPAGLAASVYAASEGLGTIVIEGNAPGGQAGTSSRIENYLGFPSGISGQELASRAQVQAQKFGAKLAISRYITAIDCAQRPFILTLEGGARVRARTIVIATGARYRKLAISNLAEFEGTGIYYSATVIESRLCAANEVIVVGGGNSAGQAVLYLATSARHVHLLIRGEELASTMSEYLMERISSSMAITLHTETEIVALRGDRQLQAVTWKNLRTGQQEERPIHHVFVMIGAEPCTAWLGGCVDLDEKGFVRVVVSPKDGGCRDYETSVPGIFVVGDVRSGSVKRVASAVGEGSVVVSAIHSYLRETENRDSGNSSTIRQALWKSEP